MSELSKALKKLQENPDDLSTLPQIIAQAEQLEGMEAEYQEREQRLRESNRNLLAQIPIAGEEPDTDPGEPAPTLADAQQHIINSLGGK